MFRIFDGRENFYQWDTNCRLVIEDATIREVHFCNRTDNCALVCETYAEDGLTLVDVPNILLQQAYKIHIYAYNGAHTKYDKCYDVRARSKPADYIYTETEVKTFEALCADVQELIETEAANEAQRQENEKAREGRLGNIEASLQQHSKRLTNLENNYNDNYFVTDSKAAYKKTVPENALPYAEIESLDESITTINSYGGNKVLSEGTVITKKFREMTVTDLGGGKLRFDGYTSWQDSDMNWETYEYNKYTFLSVPVKAGVYLITCTLLEDASTDWETCSIVVSVNGVNKNLGVIKVEEDTNIEFKMSRATGMEGATGTVYQFSIVMGAPAEELFKKFETTSSASKTNNGGMTLRIYATYGYYEKVASAILPAGTYNFSYTVDPSTPQQDEHTNLKIGTDSYNLADVFTLAKDAELGIYAMSGGAGESTSTIFYPSVIAFEPLAIDTLTTPLGEDNFILVEPTGTLAFENEGNKAVPSKVTFMIKGGN